MDRRAVLVTSPYAYQKASWLVPAKLAPAFTADTAAKTGQSERKVQRDATRGEKVASDVFDATRGANTCVTHNGAISSVTHNGDGPW